MTEDVFGIVGTVIAGAYQVEHVVAEGGFGVVYRAHHRDPSAAVALKLLKVPQQNPAQRGAFLELFRAEAELLFRLSASVPTVVRLLHADALNTSGGHLVPYLVTEWLDGLTLQALIQRRVAAGQPPVALRKLVRLLTPVARALERAHNFTGPEGAISIVHRDLKPEKIFIAQLAGEEVVKLLDLGLGTVRAAASQVAGGTSQEASAPTAFTSAYGAPEQWAPRHYGQTGSWTDVWGLALCIVETLAARTIINGDRAAMMGVALNAARRPTPRQEGVEVSDSVEAVFARALALDPRARQQDVGVFWNELTAALQAADPLGDRYAAGGARVENLGPRIELAELHSPPRVTSVPRRAASNPAVERVLAADLEFDPLSAPSSSRAQQGSAGGSSIVPALAHDAGLHFMPDLELAPPSVSRKPSSAHLTAIVAAQPMALDLDDAAAGDAGMLHLDLPSDEPISIRPVSSSRMRAEASAPALPSPPAPGRESGSIAAVRDSRPPIGARSAFSAISERDLSLISASSVRRASTPPPATSGAHAPGNESPLDLSKYEQRPLFRRLRPAFALLAAAILVALLDPTYASATGEVLKVLGLRLSVFGGVLLLLALALGAREAFRAPDP
ncbi:MAG: serine/threonine-protein kinase [Pseudomonadota bacterium]